MARAHRYHLVELLLARDALQAAAAAPGAGAPTRPGLYLLAGVGRAVAAMTGSRAELTQLLGAGVDAAEAEAAFEAEAA